MIVSVLAAGFTFAVSFAMGRALVRWMKLPLERTEELFFGFVCGAACLSLVVFVVTALGLARGGVFFVVGVAMMGAGLVVRRRVPPVMLPPLPARWKWGFVFLYALFGSLYFAAALLPETSPDALAYHLALPARYLREHSFPSPLTNFYEAFPQGMEMLFLFAFTFGKHTAGALVHFLFTLAIPLGMVSYGRRLGQPRAGIVGGLLFFMSPIVARTGTIAYVDVALACILFACFYALEIWRREKSDRVLIVAGLLAGFAFDMKYTGGLALLYLFFYVAADRRSMRLRPLAWAGVAAALAICPWLIKNYALAGNPISPFASRYFSNSFVSPQVEKAYVDTIAVQSNVRRREIPLEVTVRGGRMQGLIGPIFLLTPLMLLALRDPSGRRAIAAAVLFGIHAWIAPQTRYFLPCLPFVSLALGMALQSWPDAAVAVLAVHSITCWPDVVARYCNRFAWKMEPVSFHADPSYLEKHVPDYALGQRIEKAVPSTDRVFAFQGMQQAYQDRVIVVAWQSSAGLRMQHALTTPFRLDQQALQRVSFHVARSVSAIRIKNARSVSEVRISNVPRAPEWRLSAWPDPWDVGLAFDNNPVTQWSADAADTFVKVDFGKMITIEDVTLECQACGTAQVEYLDASNVWRAGPGATSYQVALQPWLRRAATDYLKQSGVRWLIVRDDDDGSRDFDMRQVQWGITQVAREGAAVLYRIN